VSLHRRLLRLGTEPSRLHVSSINRSGFQFPVLKLTRLVRSQWPLVIPATFCAVAHAQGTMDFSGATTLMQTFKTFSRSVSISERVGAQ
jgi:hypothetical protein